MVTFVWTLQVASLNLLHCCRLVLSYALLHDFRPFFKYFETITGTDGYFYYYQTITGTDFAPKCILIDFA